MADIKENNSNVINRFLRYIKVDTQSDEYSEKFPSTDKQKNLAIRLAQELKDMGISQVIYDEKYCYVYAAIPANSEAKENDKVIGFISHIDTSPEVSGKNVNGPKRPSTRVSKWT